MTQLDTKICLLTMSNAYGMTEKVLCKYLFDVGHCSIETSQGLSIEVLNITRFSFGSSSRMVYEDIDV